MTNILEGAYCPHFFPEKEEYLYTLSKYYQDLLQSIFDDLLLIESQWNFINNSPWFLEAIQDYIEFIPLILEQLKVRAIIPFINSFSLVGTYIGFAQVCIGLFGEDVQIEYIDATYEIGISNITSPIFQLFIAEGRDDFNFVTEDGTSLFKTEDQFIPPTGLSTLKEILKKFLPAEHSDVVTINFIT